MYLESIHPTVVRNFPTESYASHATFGVTVCNIDNGYGAACTAMRILNARG